MPVQTALTMILFDFCEINNQVSDLEDAIVLRIWTRFVASACMRITTTQGRSPAKLSVQRERRRGHGPPDEEVRKLESEGRQRRKD